MWVVLSALLAATPITLASPGFQSVNVDEKVASFALEHLSERLSQQGIRVITPTEIQALVGQERQRQLLGCNEGNTSCSAELGDALGAEATLIGTLARLGDTIELSIKVVSNRTGQRRASFSERVKNEGDLFTVMDDAAASLADQLNPKPPTVAQPGLHLRNRIAIPIIVGAVTLAGAGVFYAFSFAAHEELTNPTRPPLTDGAVRAQQGQTFQLLSAISGGVAVVAAAVAIWFYVSGAPPVLTPSLSLLRGTPTFALSGFFP